MTSFSSHLCRAITLTILAALLLVGNDFLFDFTRPDNSGQINNVLSWVTSPAFLFFSAWFAFAVVGLVLCFVVAAVSWVLLQLRCSHSFFWLPYAVPAFFLTTTLLAVIDNVTFTSFGFSAAEHASDSQGVIDTAYFIGFLCAWCWLTHALWRGRSRYRFLDDACVPRMLGCAACLLGVTGAVVWVSFERSLPVVSMDRLRGTPNIVIISIESALADVSSAYVNLPTDTTPFLREFSRRSIRVENYFSNGSGTRDSLNSIISGLHPFQNGGFTFLSVIPETVADMDLFTALRRNGYVYDILEARGPRFSEYDKNFLRHPLPPALRALNEEAFTVRAMLWSMRSRFERIVLHRDWPGQLPSPVEIKKFIDMAADGGHPFFVHIHLLESHGPFTNCSAEEMKAETAVVSWTKDPIELCYLLKLRQADASVRFFHDLVASAPNGENTIFVIAGDHPVHAEYISTSRDALRHMMRVPLFIQLPHGARAGDVLRSNAQSIDLLPTILDAVGIGAPAWGSGTSLLAPDFDARHKTRPILVVRDAKEVIACDRIWKFFSWPVPPKNEWEKVPGIVTNCGTNEFPSAADVQEVLRATETRPTPLR